MLGFLKKRGGGGGGKENNNIFRIKYISIHIVLEVISLATCLICLIKTLMAPNTYFGKLSLQIDKDIRS